MRAHDINTGDLFSGEHPSIEPLAEGAVILRGFALDASPDLMHDLQEILKVAPFRHMVTARGLRMSVGMTNCGPVGWVSDERGYRYDPLDPATGAPWPAKPESFQRLAREAAREAGYNFEPDACLVNRYEPGARLSLHQDRDERDYGLLNEDAAGLGGLYEGRPSNVAIKITA